MRRLLNFYNTFLRFNKDRYTMSLFLIFFNIIKYNIYAAEQVNKK